jgi:hypothetical protein
MCKKLGRELSDDIKDTLDLLPSEHAAADHYDLLARPGWVAKSILIISPYVEKKFFRRVVKELKPATLTVVIDDGCRPDDVTMVKALAQRGTKVQVVLGGARGLVHAKIFHVEWLTPGGRRRHTLVYGSGNATRQAFDGNINSELMCKVRLTAANHARVLEWTSDVRKAASDDARNRVVYPVRNAWLANGVSIRLPGMTIKDAGNKANNFDLWLQRGHLLSTFQPDPSFLHIHVNLRNELPPGEAERIVQNIGFETPKTRRLSFPYILSADHPDEEIDGPGNWRSRLFAWTQLGYWCSDSCFFANRDLFRKAGYDGRLQNLQLLKRLNEPDQKNTACEHFLDRVSRLWEALGSQAATYLEARSGKVDVEFYRKSFEQRVERDLELADDTEFANRYIDGCEVIDVPRFRVDASAWRSFIESFSRQIHLEWLKARSQSLLFQYIHAALKEFDEGAFDDPKALTGLLRSKWNEKIEGDDGEKISIGDYVDGYHE